MVDDEKSVRELLCFLLEKHCPQIEIIGEAHDVDSAFAEINAKKPELVFLDIQLPKGDGFSLLKKFGSVFFEVIFTTSFAEYAIPAFKVKAIDYLLKPYDINELKAAVQKAETQIGLLKNASQRADLSITVHRNDKVEHINARSILYLEARDNYTLLSLISGEKFLVPKSLNDHQSVLESLSCFIRIHRSAIINTSYIKSYSKIIPYTITMQNDACFEISRRRRTEVLDLLRSL